MANKIRLSGLAEQAGVSTATVSRVLNGKSSVSPETRQAVIAALDILGYERPEKLRERTGGLIGMIVPELTNPVFPLFAQHLASAMAIQGYTPLLGTQAAGGSTEDSYVDIMLEQHVSGIVFVSGRHADATANVERYHRITARGIPYVTMNGAHPDLSVPDFSTDDEAAVTQAIRHLVAQGHRKIGLATGPARLGPARAKAEAYRRAMTAWLPDVTPAVSHTLFTVEGGQSSAAQLVAQGCTAIVCGSDIMALGAIRAVRERGLTVPGDVSVVGSDDSPFLEFTDPPLTTVHQDADAIGSAAVRILLDEIGGAPAPRAEYIFRPHLVVRGSTGPAPTT